MLAIITIHIDRKKATQTVKKKEEKNNNTMPLLHESNVEFKFENFDDDDDDDEEEEERCHGLLIRRKISYSTQTDKSSSKTKLSARQISDTIAVNQAIACALKSHPKAFHYIQKHLQYLPPSIKHLQVCNAIRELDLHGNELKSLPNEIKALKFIEICNLGKIHNLIS